MFTSLLIKDKIKDEIEDTINDFIDGYGRIVELSFVNEIRSKRRTAQLPLIFKFGRDISSVITQFLPFETECDPKYKYIGVMSGIANTLLKYFDKKGDITVIDDTPRYIEDDTDVEFVRNGYVEYYPCTTYRRVDYEQLHEWHIPDAKYYSDRWDSEDDEDVEEAEEDVD